MPKADRIAAVGTSAAPVRCNKTVAKINLSKMRTSCQINYPESPSKHHVAPTVGGVAKPAPPRNSLDHMHLKKADQLKPDDIKKEIVESFVGNHSGLFSDWEALGGRESPSRRGGSPQKRRHKIVKVAEAAKAHSVSDRHVNRHSREHIKQDVEARRMRQNKKQDNVILGSTIIARNELTAMQEETGFGTDELRKVMESFKAHASFDPEHNKVTPEHFYEVMTDVFDGMTQEMSLSLFKSMDDDGSGMVDYRELIKGCAKLVHDATTDERFKLIFDAYDHDGGGTISADELMKIAHEKGQEMDESLELVKNVMSTMDADGTGQVDFGEFLTAAKDTPLLLDAFEQLLPSPHMLKKHVQELGEKSGNTFDWERLNDMSTFLRSRSTSGSDHGAVNRATFRTLMEDFFGFHDPILTGTMFDTMDKDGGGLIDFKELLTGLSTALRGNPQQRLDFYFGLYDMDGSGSIDEDEIYRLLERGHGSSGRMNSESAKASLQEHGLAGLDADSDGHISHDEFLKAVNDNPKIMEMFGQVVH